MAGNDVGGELRHVYIDLRWRIRLGAKIWWLYDAKFSESTRQDINKLKVSIETNLQLNT